MNRPFLLVPHAVHVCLNSIQSAGSLLTFAETYGEQWKTRVLFVFTIDRGLKCLTCISWFTLKFGMKLRLTPEKQCSL